MAKKNKKGRKMPMWRRIASAGLRIVGVATGTIVATGPVHRGLGTLATTGNFAQSAAEIREDFGVKPAGIDFARMAQAGATVGVGVAIYALFNYLSRRI